MRRNLLKAALLFFVMTIIFGACTKGGDGQRQSQSAGTKTTASISSSTAVKTSAKAVSTNATAASKTGTGANAGASVNAAQADGNSALDAVPNDNSQTDSQEDDSANQNGWAGNISAGELGGIAGDNIDLHGATIVAGTWSPATVPYDLETENPDEVIWARRIKAAEEKYNFKMEWYVEPGGNSTNYINKLITQAVSGVKLCDIFRTATSYQFPMFVKNKVIVPLDGYLDYESAVIRMNKMMYKGSYWKGSHYGISSSFRTAYQFLMYNGEMLEREGQPDILSLVENMQWDWTSFLEIAKNCTRDTNADGIIDQYGVTAPSEWYLCKYFLYSNGLTSGVEVTADNKAYLIINSPAAIRTFQFISDLTFIHKVFKKESVTTGAYPKGNAAMMINNWCGPNTVLINNGMKSYVAPMPMGPDTVNYNNTNAVQFYVVSAQCPIPGETAKVFFDTGLLWTEDEDFIPEVKVLMEKYYPADWSWNPSNPARLISTEREYIINFTNAFKLLKPDYTDGYPNLSKKMETLISIPVMTGEKSVVQAMNSAESELQAIIDGFE